MRYLILALCALGLYVASSMQAKAVRAARGELVEASVVQSPNARLIGQKPNSLFGIFYYMLLALAAIFLDVPAVHDAAIVVASLAAIMSLYLAYSLLYITRMPCVYCWTGHVVNWALLAVVAAYR